MRPQVHLLVSPGPATRTQLRDVSESNFLTCISWDGQEPSSELGLEVASLPTRGFPAVVQSGNLKAHPTGPSESSTGGFHATEGEARLGTWVQGEEPVWKVVEPGLL